MYQCCGFRELALTGTGTARTVRATAVSAGFFEVVRARPALGRVFRQEEDTPGGKHVVVLSDRFWRTEFGGHPDVIGRTVKLNDEAYTIVGVMPATASVASWTGMASDVWVPLALTDEQRAARGNHNRDGVARLKRDVELAQAQAEMDAISARLAREFPQTDDGWGAVVIPMQEEIVGNSRTMLLMLLGAVGLVLLIACANVGNLLFTRALSRRKEIAIRSALGAGRGRVFQQLLTEALLLAGAGGALGLLLAYGTLTSASTLLAGQVPRAEEISIDGRVLLFAVGVSMLTGMLAGTLPAVRARPVRPQRRAQGRWAQRRCDRCRHAPRADRVRGRAVAGVVDGRWRDDPEPAGPQARRHRLRSEQRPHDARETGGRAVSDAGQRSAFFDAALQRIRALPGVEAAGTIDDLPFADGSSQTLALEGYPPQRDPVAVQVRQITPGYLRAMGIPVLRGRDVVDSDAEVLLVSQDAAKLYWGADDPIGRRATYRPCRRRCFVRWLESWATSSSGTSLKAPRPRCTTTRASRLAGRRSSYGHRCRPPRSPSPPLQRSARSIRSSRSWISRRWCRCSTRKLTPQRFSALLLGVFAGVALLLAAVGIYSVLSYIVRGRSREIGIRTALGARTADVLRLVIVEGMSPALVGIAAGTIAALASAKVMETLVFGVSASALAAAGPRGGLVGFIGSVGPPGAQCASATNKPRPGEQRKTSRHQPARLDPLTPAAHSVLHPL